MKKTTRKHGYQRNLLSLSTPSKNRTNVGLVSKLQRRLATTALLGLASVRSACASAANTGKASALAGMMTWV
jgi:hypothetical protein